MLGFIKSTSLNYHANKEDFERHLEMYSKSEGFYRLKVNFLNTQHMMHQQPESQLAAPVKDLLMFLLDEYFPMGLNSIDQLNVAEEKLKEIRMVLSIGNKVDIAEMIAWYEMVPHSGNECRLQAIDSIQKCDSKLGMLIRFRSLIESLLAGRESSLNPIDYFLRYGLRTELNVIDCDSPDYQNIQDCIEKTQHPNSHFLRLKNLFGVSSHANSNFNHNIGNHTLLYHFTHQSNILGILREGLLVAPSHIYSVNRFFGPGIYFLDCASIALSKFREYPPNTAVLLICRVALGNEQMVQQQYLGEGQEFIFKDGINSLRCNGLDYSETNKQYNEINGAKMFCGQIQGSLSGFDAYNKYLVPNANQVKIEYIAEFEKI